MNTIKAVFFDLDNTLIAFDEDEFVKFYLKGLSEWMSPLGYDPNELVQAILFSLKRMAANRGPETNEQIFWKAMGEKLGQRVIADISAFEAYYENDYRKLASLISVMDGNAQVVQTASKIGPIILATNPFFPATATCQRASWGKIDPKWFDWITTYDNSRSSKPDASYFLALCEQFSLKPEEVLMVGNDLSMDWAARNAGLQFFTVTDRLMNEEGYPYLDHPHGNLRDLNRYLEDHLNRMEKAGELCRK